MPPAVEGGRAPAAVEGGGAAAAATAAAFARKRGRASRARWLGGGAPTRARAPSWGLQLAGMQPHGDRMHVPLPPPTTALSPTARPAGRSCHTRAEAVALHDWSGTVRLWHSLYGEACRREQ